MNNNNNIFDYKKLLIGPLTIFCEHMSFGYAMGNIKITKQATGNLYPNIVKNQFRNGLFKGLYGGYLQYGLPQTLKGFPLLFTQHAVENSIIKYANDDIQTNKKRKIISGVIGGSMQAIFITPFQRGRSIMLTSTGEKSFYVVQNVVKKDGISTLIKGILPTITRCSLDWGIRFGVKATIEDYLKNDYLKKEGLELIDENRSKIKLSNFQKIQCGMVAGFVSSITIPFDTMIAMTQKFDKNKRSSFDIIRSNYQKYGVSIFTRGLCIKLTHSILHTAFVVGGGDIISDYYNSEFTSFQ